MDDACGRQRHGLHLSRRQPAHPRRKCQSSLSSAASPNLEAFHHHQQSLDTGQGDRRGQRDHCRCRYFQCPKDFRIHPADVPRRAGPLGGWWCIGCRQRTATGIPSDLWISGPEPIALGAHGNNSTVRNLAGDGEERWGNETKQASRRAEDQGYGVLSTWAFLFVSCCSVWDQWVKQVFEAFCVAWDA